MSNAYFPIIFDFGYREPAVSDESSPPASFLTDQDWKTLLQTSRFVSYQDGDVILEKGAYQHSLFVIEKGTVRVERSPQVVLARRGQGAVFGEVSLLDHSGASASVVAEGDVDVSVLAEDSLNAQLAAAPALATRFYQTLAVTLARRLREAAERASQR
jgi:extracellular factor (EF) 3-hydroxypalmitic acid methyl ester biosynthesis protein